MASTTFNTRTQNRIPSIQKGSLEASLFFDLYGKTTGWVKMLSSNPHYQTGTPAQKQDFFASDCFKGDAVLDDMLNLSGFSRKNLWLSTAIYGRKGRATENNIVAATAILIDVDYAGKFEKKSSTECAAWLLGKLQDMENSGIPVAYPSYIECGHRLRLIYVFDTAVCLKIKKRAHRASTIRLLKKVTRYLCNMVNEADPDLHPDFAGSGINKFIRPAGSVTVKRQKGQMVTMKEDGKMTRKYIPGPADAWLVQLLDWKGPLWEMHELVETILPVYTAKAKKNKQSRKSHATQLITLENRLKARLVALRNRQAEGMDVGYREISVFLYWNTCLALGYSDAKAAKLALEFNHGFRTPLPDYVVIKQCRPSRAGGYKFTDKHFAEYLGCEMPELSGSDSRSRRSRYLDARKEQIGAGKTKQQQMEKKAAIVVKLREEGKTLQAIADQLGVSLSTVKRYLKYKPVLTAAQKLRQEIKALEMEARTISAQYAREVKDTCKQNVSKVTSLLTAFPAEVANTLSAKVLKTAKDPDAMIHCVSQKPSTTQKASHRTSNRTRVFDWGLLQELSSWQMSGKSTLREYLSRIGPGLTPAVNFSGRHTL